MCTLIVSFQQHESVPVLVAANRDEVRGRPASAPRRWPGENFVAPKDEQAGGTWLGLTSSGLFVAVTNRFPSVRHEDRQSRGMLVVEALRAKSAAVLREQMEQMPFGRFNTFHLLYADAHAAFVTWSDGSQIQHAQLAPGLHVVTERSLGGDEHGRKTRIENAWPSLPRESGIPTSEGLQQLLATRNPEDPSSGVCVDIPEWNYGTRSSLVLFASRTLSQSRWLWAEGRPDKVAFTEHPDLIASLSGPQGA